MRFSSIQIKNFKYIRSIKINNIENALILVGKNNTGKTAILDAVRAVSGSYAVQDGDFNEKKQKVEIQAELAIDEEDLKLLHYYGIVSQYRRYDIWYEDFCRKLPSYKNGILHVRYTANYQGEERYGDGVSKNNRYIREVMPKVFFIGTDRNLEQIQDSLLSIEEDVKLKQLRAETCMFDQAKKCTRCFQCIGLINQKSPEDLSALEAVKLLEYKLSQLNLQDFARKVNRSFHKNGGFEEIRYSMRCDIDKVCRVATEAYNKNRAHAKPISQMGEGMKSIYMLSLLEAYAEDDNRVPSIMVVEDPEMFLHPQLQKKASEIIYQLSKKNQVMFTTHSPDMIFNFNSRQIRQVVLDRQYNTAIREGTDIDRILDDLGYNAMDLMNVSFVFIVEGKQDKSRLPLLLEKYYSEVYDEKGRPSRIAILTTNSCTNIKTYANLKYMNQLYLKEQFLMIRDGDGMDREELAGQLCRYYAERNLEDADRLPRVLPRNVLVLKYYSFENYFLNPAVMAQLGILDQEEDFYRILLEKWKEYLYRIRSGRHLSEVLGFEIQTEEELKAHMEEVKIYLRGHNLYDIFYGRYRDREQEILKKYIELAPREDFKDILDAVDRFIYFDNRKIKSL